MAGRQLSVNEDLDILRTTVPRLAARTDGVPPDRLHAADGEIGWMARHEHVHLKQIADTLKARAT